MFLQRPLKYYFRHSFVFHFALVGLFILLAKILSIKMENRLKVNTILAQSSVRVDVVAMPKMTLKELKVIKIKPSPVEEGKTKPAEVKEEAKLEDQNDSAISFEKKGAKKLSFAERMKLLSEKKTLQEKVSNKMIKSKTKKSNTKPAENKELNALIAEGNQLSKGTSLTGSSNAQTLEAFESYIQELPGHIKENWKLPSYLLEQNLNCAVRIYLAENGRLLKAEIYESSGVPEYDAKALEAIRKSSPFPNLSKEIRIRGINGEIILGFPI